MLRQDPNSLARRAESLRRAGDLAGGERPFALVMVVRTEPATSARIGDRAIVFADGSLDGWVGGGCIGPTARKEALAALEEGVTRLVRVTPDTAAAQPGVRMARMTCASEGTADLYVEPFLPRPTLIVAGDSPVVATLTAIAPPLGFRLLTMDSTTRLTPGEVPYPQDSWMVVATFGEFDEDAVEAGIRLGLPYVGLVASAQRAEQVLSELRTRGLEEGELAVVRSPAGLPLGTSGQEGISLSVMAEISSLRAEARPSFSGVQERESAGEPDTAVDPVCGMAVEMASARHVVEQGGTRYYFCCAGCRRTFEQRPEKYETRVSLR
ncbi:MAG TPA: XdhC family protein [Rubrobacter sp.]|jgi:xanthine dehydrogenase accessory factor|nr:XdhC family protein [Rubrobacter sp.]